MSFQLIDTGLVYRNPKPYLRAVNAWHPSLVSIGDNKVLVSFDLGQGPESLDYQTYLSRSEDGGNTWSLPEPIFRDTVQPSTFTVRLSRVSTGIVGMGTRLHRHDPEEGILNRENHGFVPMDVITVSSTDNGQTWSEPRNIQPPLVGPGFEVCHPIIELQDGRWLWPTSTLAGWNGEAPNGLKSTAFVSHDKGATWPDFIDTFDDYDKGIGYWEQSIVQMPDGRLVAVAWALDNNTGKALPTPYRVSTDGHTFGPQRETGIQGQTAKLLPLDENHLLCVYRRVDKAGLWANLVELNGNDWNNLEEIPLWQGAATGMTGERSKSEELSELKFGYPSLLQTSTNEVLVAFWCYEDTVWNIRWVRIHV